MNENILDEITLSHTNSGELVSFEYAGENFRIARCADMSNMYLVYVDDMHTDWCWVAGVAIWTAPRNEFAISTDGHVHIPYDVLLPNLREANTRYLELVRNSK